MTGTLRIEKSSIYVYDTGEPVIKQIECDCTYDPEGTENPTMTHVSVSYNTNTDFETLLLNIEAGIPDNSLRDTIRAAIGSTVYIAQSPGITNITIETETVNVNQV